MRKIVLMCLLFAAPALASNVALGGVAYQSSDLQGYGAWLAIDGSTCGDLYGCHSTTHTDLDSPAFWYVDLLNTYVLSEIDIWNRTDCCGSRLHDFHVGVYDSSWTEVWGGDYFTGGGYPSPELSIPLPQGTAGEFVKIYLNNSDYLSLAEVQVYDAGVPEPATFGLIGLSALALGVLRRR